MSFLLLKDVCFAWPGGGRLLDSVDLRIQASDTIALMGANGSGKTTLGKLMLGLIQPTQGTIELQGKPLSAYTLAQRGELMGYIFQNPEKQLFAASVSEDIALPLRFRGVSREKIAVKTAELLTIFELEHCKDKFPFNLSQGEKQRLALAGVMGVEPKFLILDEPSSGLDWLRKQQLARILHRLAEAGTGYILISHDPKFCADLCRRRMVLRGGTLHES